MQDSVPSTRQPLDAERNQASKEKVNSELKRMLESCQLIPEWLSKAILAKSEDKEYGKEVARKFADNVAAILGDSDDDWESFMQQLRKKVCFYCYSPTCSGVCVRDD